MSASILPNIPSLRKQQLYLDFNALKASCPESIYLSLTPDNPALWYGVFFVRKGPYDSVILRFNIAFPDTYPDLPPLITFSTEIFHPLVAPLTTYTFSTGLLDATGTVSASDEERLPPGAFSLRDGFPHWFGRARRSQEFSSRPTSSGGLSPPSTPGKPLNATSDVYVGPRQRPQHIPVTKVLAYMKAAFEDADLLDKISLEAAGNSGAWHAWRAYRDLPKMVSRPTSPSGLPGSPNRMSKHPGEWNWSGVWESRVKNGIESSTSEPVLFGSGNPRNSFTGYETIRFANMDDERLAEFRKEMLESNTNLNTTV